VIPTQSVPEVLEATRKLVQPALLDSLRQLSEEIRPLGTYHHGFADLNGRVVADSHFAGKGVRPALALLSCEAVGGDARDAIPAAVAVELVHNFSLVHDDIIDNDAERRHRTTLWAAFGTGRAIVAGDALHALALEVLLDSVEDAELALRAARCLVRATSTMIAGQALDMSFETHETVSVERCRSMEAQKTGALIGCAASLGAILGRAPELAVAELETFGVELGLSFQAVDDLLGIWGDPSVTGKPTFSDLRQAKKTLPIVVAMASGRSNARQLSELLSHGDDEDRLAEAAALIEGFGGRAAAMESARDHLRFALHALERVPLVPGARDALVSIARFVIEREF
jgi:geranylgeranyl diphosphate synthase type I